jgi:eukaryotic-like serine/threonine-protein kinase
LHYGRLAKARDLIQLSVSADQREGLNASAAATQALATLWEAEYGELDLARRNTSAVLATSAGRNAKIAAALTWAELKGVSHAQTMVAELNQRFPDATLLNNIWLPTIRAKIALSRGDSAQAINLLEAAIPYDLSQTPPLPSFYAGYVRGKAYLQAQRADAAAQEFQTILNHKGLLGASPVAAVARLGLARARALGGNTAAARIAYQVFFALWKDADPDLPLLKQAKAEYAQL